MGSAPVVPAAAKSKGMVGYIAARTGGRVCVIGWPSTAHTAELESDLAARYGKAVDMAVGQVARRRFRGTNFATGISLTGATASCPTYRTVVTVSIGPAPADPLKAIAAYDDVACDPRYTTTVHATGRVPVTCCNSGCYLRTLQSVLGF
jgi:hypothetical protein